MNINDLNKNQKILSPIASIQLNNQTNNFKDIKRFNNFNKKKIILTTKVLNDLKNFLTKDAKIYSRRKTHLTNFYQQLIKKYIKKARNFGLIPLNINIIE